MFGVFDVALDCDMPLPELAPVESAGQVISVKRGNLPANSPGNAEWLHDWLDEDGGVVISGFRLGRDYLLRFPDLVDFVISLSQPSITYIPEAEVPAESVRHLLLDQAIPRMLGQMGRQIVHASAICLPDGCGVAFLGDSGWGKSTLTASYLGSDAHFVTDDCLMLAISESGVHGIANYYGARLFDDSAYALFKEPKFLSTVAHYTDKKRVSLFHLANAAERKVPMSALFVLNDPVKNPAKEGVLVEPLTGANGLMSIIKQTFFIDVKDKETYSGQFTELGKLVGLGTSIFSLSYPRQHEYLPEVRRAVKESLHS